MSKYEKLKKVLDEIEQNEIELSFSSLNEILGFPLDHSFLKYENELLSNGFVDIKISLKKQYVRFKKEIH